MRGLYGLLLILAGAPAAGDWERVLSQIDLPHHYYYREMYLPQYTTGPGSLAWSPDGRELVYAMQGSLWRQALDSDVAIELTDGPGDDYQPDWSPDGERIVFVRYHGDAMELHELELATGIVRRLTDGGAVNVDPRYAPDGKRLAWISTAASGRFRLFTGEIQSGKLQGAPLRPERRSEVARYYYSPFDHELSPAWSPDGRELLFVTNPEVPYGTGNLYRLSLSDPGTLHPVRVEETNWRMRPDWSPDGRRIVYSSYLGRQWHQLWAVTREGGPPMPLSYGEHDITNARFSPDGRFIAAISNEGGNTRIRIQDTASGAVRFLAIGERKYRSPTGRLVIETRDGANNLVPARLSVVDRDGGTHIPDDVLAHGSDGFDRRLQRVEVRYFHSPGRVELATTPGRNDITIWRGLEHEIVRQKIHVPEGGVAEVAAVLEPLDLPPEWQNWKSGDLHVHMNYGGTYRMTPDRLHAMAAAEDLDVVHNLVVNKEQRIPDIAYFTGRPDPVSDPRVLILHDQEFHTSLWGHLGIIGLRDHYLLPDYSAYPYTFAASPWPHNGAVADLAHEQQALAGYVHPFDWFPEPEKESLANNLPVDAALGRIDYYEVVGFSDHRASADVWHRLLNCGMRLSAGAGTDAMTNYASLRGPIGMNRVYARAGQGTGDVEADRAQWLQAIARGHTLATNGPLLVFEVEGRGPGESLEGAARRVRYAGAMRSIVPVRKLEILVNGVVTRSIRPGRGGRSADFEGALTLHPGDWVLVRAWDEEMSPLILDLYPYATTNPVFMGTARPNARCEPDYFLRWTDDIEGAVRGSTDYNGPAERQQILDDIRRARSIWEGLRADS